MLINADLQDGNCSATYLYGANLSGSRLAARLRIAQPDLGDSRGQTYSLLSLITGRFRRYAGCRYIHTRG